MPHRLARINELIRQELGKIIFEQEEFDSGVLVTLMAAETSQDLRHTTLTVSVLPTERGAGVIKKLSAHVFNLQKQLNKKIRMHPVPKIRFVLDSTESESQKINNLLEKIK